MRTLIILALLSVTLAVPFSGYSKCDSSATYHVTLTGVDVSPYPI